MKLPSVSELSDQLLHFLDFGITPVGSWIYILFTNKTYRNALNKKI
jgi:hypothetical protein